VRTSIRVGLVGVLSASLVFGVEAAASAKSSAISTKQYAKRVCAVYTAIPKDLDAFTTAYNTAPNTDPAAFQAAVVTSTSALERQLGRLATRLKKVHPDVDSGTKIAKLFANDLQRYHDKVSSALATFKSADPAGAAFVGDQAKFEAAITLLRTSSANDPFSKVDDQDLLGAFDKAKSCAKVVRIYGG
jgi:predicted outer membrane protein